MTHGHNKASQPDIFPVIADSPATRYIKFFLFEETEWNPG